MQAVTGFAASNGAMAHAGCSYSPQPASHQRYHRGAGGVGLGMLQAALSDASLQVWHYSGLAGTFSDLLFEFCLEYYIVLRV